MSITAFNFGEWLPDLPDLGNPGLTEALNVLPLDGSYRSFLPLVTSGSALPQIPIGAFFGASVSARTLYVATGGTVAALTIFRGSGAGWSTVAATASFSVYGDVDFAQFDSMVLMATGGTPLRHTLGSVATAGSLSISGDPLTSGSRIGVVNRFVVLGDYGTAHAYVRWSAINDPTNWPTPNSATAIATQAGEQYLDDVYGEVTGITSGDQFGLIFQINAITRMTYAGPPVVFQFDKVDRVHGAMYPNSIVQVGNLTYFAALDGFYVTDGVSVVPIGYAKMDRYFRGQIVLTTGAATTGKYRMTGAYDHIRGLLIWAIATTASNSPLQPHELLIYNPAEKRWSHAIQDCFCPVQIAPSNFGNFLDSAPAEYGAISAFDSSFKVGQFSGTPGTAILISAEVEPNPGGCAFINGVKPVIASSGGAPTVGVQVGSRDDQSAAITYATTAAPTSRTGFADFRADNRYHRARVYITGAFDKAQGVEIDATASGGL